MPIPYDPAYLAAAGPVIEMLKAIPKAAVHDLEASRVGIHQLFSVLLANEGGGDITEEDGVYTTTTADGYELAIYHFYPRTPALASSSSSVRSSSSTSSITSTSSAPAGSSIPTTTGAPALYHLHGAGLASGYPPLFASLCRVIVDATGLQVFAPQYRLAPDHHLSTGIHDTYAGLTWLQANSRRFNIDPTRIAVVGESDGAGLAASLCLHAAAMKLEPPIKKVQMLYPLLDDRPKTRDPQIDREGLLMSYALVKVSWDVRLGGGLSGDGGNGVVLRTAEGDGDGDKRSGGLDREEPNPEEACEGYHTVEGEGAPETPGASQNERSAKSTTDYPPNPAIPPTITAPARATDAQLKGFPSAYIDVGSIDVVRDESVEFARRLWRAGSQVELHVWPGVPHVFELFAPEIPITQLAMERRVAFWDDL